MSDKATALLSFSVLTASHFKYPLITFYPKSNIHCLFIPNTVFLLPPPLTLLTVLM